MHFLNELAVLALAATLLVALTQKLRLPSLLGFLVAGLVVGPAGLGWVSDVHAIEVMAEVGIVLLMFTIGLEVSLRELTRMAGQVFGGGGLQMLITTAVAGGVAWALGLEVRAAILVGLVVSTSSTALVLRLLGDRGELPTPQGRISLAILLFQDLAVVLLILLVPILAGEGAGPLELGWSVLKAALLTVGLYVAARFAFPWLLRRLLGLRSRELFLLVTLATVMGTAWLAGLAGLSLALGAFIAGLVISESEFSHQMFAEVLPFREVFNGLFFMSVGMLVSPKVVLEQPLLVLGLVVGVIVVKAAIVLGLGVVFRLSWRKALLAGLGLSQVGEFGFVLAQKAAAVKIIEEGTLELLITTSVASMALTPLLLMASGGLRRPRQAAEIDAEAIAAVAPNTQHVIVVGYGINGRNVARALKQLKVPYVVVEMNTQTVADERERGEPLVFGDATNSVLLGHLHLDAARALIVCVADAAATRAIVATAHHMNPRLEILARTRFIAELTPLRELGASHVVPEEFETSLELVGRVLRVYNVPDHAIEREKAALRRAQYETLTCTGDLPPGPSLTELLADVDVEHLELPADHPICGRSLRDINLRALTGATLLAVLRQGETLPNPGGDLVLAPGDVLTLMGRASQLAEARQRLLHPEEDEGASGGSR